MNWSSYARVRFGFAEGDGSTEVKSDIPVLLAEEIDSAILLLYAVLRDFTVDDVCTGSPAASVGCLLHSSGDVFYEYSAVTKVFPIFDTVSTL